jgi:hypothetical protein
VRVLMPKRRARSRTPVPKRYSRTSSCSRCMAILGALTADSLRVANGDAKGAVRSALMWSIGPTRLWSVDPISTVVRSADPGVVYTPACNRRAGHARVPYRETLAIPAGTGPFPGRKGVVSYRETALILSGRRSFSIEKPPLPYRDTGDASVEHSGPVGEAAPDGQGRRNPAGLSPLSIWGQVSSSWPMP